MASARTSKNLLTRSEIMRECLRCSFPVTPGLSRCPKCDADLARQTDGSTATIDIAHHRETIEIAIRKLDQAISHHRSALTQTLRVVVGRGRIGAATASHLRRLELTGEIESFGFEPGNPGAILVQLKRGPRMRSRRGS